MNKKTMWIGGAAAAVVLVLTGAGIAVAVDGFDDDDDRQTTQQQDQGTGAPSNGDYLDDDGDDDRNDNDADNDPDDAPISEADRASAEKAALAAAGGGRVTDVDRSDDADHAWEVEVSFDGGSETDVELDAGFEVVRVDPEN